MAASSSTPAAEPTPEQIAERARSIWIARGSPGGRDLEHWLDAEQQLREELNARSRPAKRPPPSGRSKPGREADPVEAEKQLDGLIEQPPSPARRTPAGEQL